MTTKEKIEHIRLMEKTYYKLHSMAAQIGYKWDLDHAIELEEILETEGIIQWFEDMYNELYVQWTRE